MHDNYKFTWFNSKRSWSQFFKDIKFYARYKFSPKEIQTDLARQKDFEDNNPIRHDKI